MGLRIGLRSITGKLLAAFLAVFVCVTALQHYLYYAGCKEREAIAQAARASAARTATATLEHVLDHVARDLRVIRQRIAGGADGASSEDILRDLAEFSTDYVAVGLLDVGSGRNYCYPPPAQGKNGVSLPPPRPRADTAVSSVQHLPTGSVFTVSIPATFRGGSPVVVYAVVPADVVARELRALVPPSCFVVVLDRDGKSVCRVGDEPAGCQTRRLNSVSEPAEGQIVELAGLGVPGCMATSPLSQWRIAVFGPRDGQRQIGVLTVWLPWPTLITALAASVIFFTIGNRIASPIRKLSRAAAAVAVGDLRRRVEIDTGDELQSLAESFNRMAASLEQHERELRMRSRVQQSLFEVTRTVTASLDLGRVAASITEALASQFGAKQAATFLLDEESGKLEPVHLDHSEDEQVYESMRRFAEHVLSSPGKIPRPVAVAYEGPETAGGPIIAIPLVVGSRTVGVLTAAFPPEPSDPGIDHRAELLQTFASCAAVAIHNASMYGRIQEISRVLVSLRRVEEAISSSLDLKHVLHCLVRTTCEVMGAKACAILLADRNGRLSVAEAHNLSKEFRSKLNLWPGERWTGVAFAEKRPIVRSDVASESDLRLRDDVANEGLHGFLCAPLVAADETIGTINVWMDRPYAASSTEAYLLTSIASHAAAVIANAKLFGREYQIAETLQGTLMGEVPDRLGRLVFGHKYVPGTDEAQVGGDLYDVVTLPNGKVGLIVADVSGKGIEAAVHTAMIRYMARAFAFEWPDSPSAALNLLNRALISYLDSRVLVTAFYAILDPANGRLLYANAGHPPAIALTHRGRRQTLFYRTGLPLGCSSDSTYDERELVLTPGDMLLLYTDGVIEARRNGCVLSLEGLQDILFRHAQLAPPDLVEVICEETRKFTESDLKDDIAVIAAAIEPGPDSEDLVAEAGKAMKNAE